jgi:hypothetical protein
MPFYELGPFKQNSTPPLLLHTGFRPPPKTKAADWIINVCVAGSSVLEH